VPGLDHLEGEDVSAFGDGYVAASAKNADYEVVTVTGGEATLSRCYSVIHVGLPITSDLETLDVDLADSRSLANQNKKSSSVVLWLEDTRGGFVGPKPPEDDTRNTTADPLYGLVEFKPRSMEDYDDTPDLKTGPHELKILPEWNSNGRIFIRQVDPLPMSVLGIVIDGTYPRG
jgi:hypothetical protein